MRLCSVLRDRAKERRDGLNVDYQSTEAELLARGLGSEALPAISIQDSKFLGGDLEHTHLVKGLDYALLQQVRWRQRCNSKVSKQGWHDQWYYMCLKHGESPKQAPPGQGGQAACYGDDGAYHILYVPS